MKRLKFVKRILSIFLCTLLVCVLAVPAMAKSVSYSSYPIFTRMLPKVDGNYQVTINGDAMTEDAKTTYKQILSDINNPERVVMIYFQFIASDLYNQNFYLASFDRSTLAVSIIENDKNETVSLISNDSYVIHMDNSSKTDKFYRNCRSVAYNKPLYIGYYSKSVFYFMGDGYELDSRLSVLSDVPSIKIIDGLPEEPSSSSSVEEPDPPSSSSVEEPDPPTPPFSGDDLPYDVAIWDDMVAYIRTAVGSIGHILILTMFLLAAIPIITAVIRHFISQGKSGGGGGGLI